MPAIRSAPMWLLLMAASAVRASADDPLQPERFRADVAPFVAKYCAECHSGPKAKADLRVDLVKTPAAVLKARDDWESMLVMVQDRAMPPEGKPRPSEAEIAAFVDWVESALSTADCTGPADPGRVTMRRLNRAEYANTVRDLVGVEFRAAAEFPSDDVGYGFDNIGDVLTLPPLLMEKYLDAAASIAEQAIQAPELAQIPETKLAVSSATLVTTGNQAAGEIDLPYKGTYALRVLAWADQAGDEPAKMGFLIDGKPSGQVEVKATKKAPREYTRRLDVERAGRHKFAVAFLNDFYDEKNSNPRRRDRNLHVDALILTGPERAELPPPGPAQKKLFAPGDLIADETAKLRAIVADFACRAFRRPVTRDEVDRYLALAQKVRDDDQSLQRAVQVAVMAILVSPNFLFRVEVDAAGAPSTAAQPLGDWALASRLSYFLWGSMPDAELFKLARQGSLRDPAELERQTRRMLADPRSNHLVTGFATQWLTIRRLEAIRFDPHKFPKYDPKLRDAMMTETSMFFEAVMREDRSILDFLDGPYTFVNEQLAEHYGIPGVKGEHFRKVGLTDGRRGGIVTHGTVLAVTSNPTRTSPVKRGKFILEQVLGTPPPPPPPEVPELETGELKGTLKQQMEQHRTNPSCASCHVRMDGLGFALENFDAVGAWRERDGEVAVDATGELPGGVKLDGPAGLRKALRAQADRFRSNFAEKLLCYALGRGLDAADACAVQEIVKATQADRDKFHRVIVEIVKSDPFRKRRGSPGGSKA